MSTVSAAVNDALAVLRLLRSLPRIRVSRRKMGLIRTIVIFGAGFYSGVYACQNYQIPPFDDPTAVAGKISTLIRDFLEQHRKDK